MTSSTPPPQRSATLNLPILEENPYAGHPELSSLEANVLWEYAKMAAMVKQVSARFLRSPVLCACFAASWGLVLFVDCDWRGTMVVRTYASHRGFDCTDRDQTRLAYFLLQHPAYSCCFFI